MIDIAVPKSRLERIWTNRADPEQSVKRQYFIAYAVMGSLGPFLPIFLQRQIGLNEAQIGYAMGASNIAVLLTPVLMTFLADSRQDSRKLLAFIFGISSLALIALNFVYGFWPAVLFLCIHSLAYVAMVPLQDGLNFAVQRYREAEGRIATPYHIVRVWGTIGFIVPSLLLFGFLRQGWAVNMALFAAAGFCLMGLYNSFKLPDPDLQRLQEENGEAPQKSTASRLPTVEAARALMRPQVIIFCLGMMLAYAASSAYYGFFALYLTQVVKVEEHWVGPIFNIGVVFEIGYMLAFGWLLNRFGFKKCPIVGVIGMGLRMAALALYPTPIIAAGMQVVHGLVVITTMVAPPFYLNRQAGDSYRSSIQGLYTMVVSGSSRIVGSFLAGHLAHQYGLTYLFGWAATLSFIAAAILLLGFRDDFHLSAPGSE